jgi:DNA polymerase III gamma/tau subunit
MKNATAYEKKVKKLLGKSMTGRGQELAPPPLDQAAAQLVEAILQADTTLTQAATAAKKLTAEFVDINELRVSPLSEIVDCIGRDFPLAQTKAEVISIVLAGVYHRTCGIDISYMNDMPKRDLRRHLREIGMTPYAEAVVTMTVFGGHAVPVDDALFEILLMEELVHPESDVEDTQAFLERIVPAKNAPDVHEFLRGYVAKNLSTLQKKRDAEARKRAEQEEAKRKAAEAEEKKKQAEKKAREEKAAQAAAAAEKRAAQAEEKKAAAKKAKAAQKSSARKKTAAPKKASPTKTKTAKKKNPAKKSAKKTKTKSAAKSTKKTAQKKATKKKTAKKAAKASKSKSKSKKS